MFSKSFEPRCINNLYGVTIPGEDNSEVLLVSTFRKPERESCVASSESD